MVEWNNWTSDQSSKMVFKFDLSFDITDQYLSYTGPSLSLPLAVSWSFELRRDQSSLKILIHHRGLSVSQIGGEVAVRLELCQLDRHGTEHTIDVCTWEPTDVPEEHRNGVTYSSLSFNVPQHKWWDKSRRSNNRYQLNSHRRYRVTAVSEEDYPDVAGKSTKARQEGFAEGRKEGLEQGRKEGREEAVEKALPEVQAQRASGAYLKPMNHDLRLFFPLAHPNGAELWAKSDLLVSKSSYFKTLLESGFIESNTRGGKRARLDPVSVKREGTIEAVQKEFDDSDDGTDKIVFSRRPPNRADVDEVSHHQTTITQTAFSTYHAALIWLETGYLSFAPLTSTSPDARHTFINAKLSASPNLPPPVSPKSLYRLADLLDLPDLKRLSIDAFRSALTVSGAAEELFDAASVHADIRDAVLAYIKSNLVPVKESEGWKTAVRRIQQGEIAGATVGPVPIELMRMGITL